MISAKNIKKSYGDALILGDVSVDIPRGGLTSIIGPNGAGKSTLLAIIARLLGMDAGTVTVDGMDVTKAPSIDLARRMAIMRQDNHMTARLTVRDLVAFGRYPYTRGKLKPYDHAHVARAMGYMGMTDLADRFLDQLSGGQRQRAFAAMVLCQDTDYVLLDEPLNNLDIVHAQGMMKQLRRMCVELNKTVVVVLHDINFASWHSDHIIAMKNGAICEHGPTCDIMRPEPLRKIYGTDIKVVDIDGKPTAIYYA